MAHDNCPDENYLKGHVEREFSVRICYDEWSITTIDQIG